MVDDGMTLDRSREMLFLFIFALYELVAADVFSSTASPPKDLSGTHTLSASPMRMFRVPRPIMALREEERSVLVVIGIKSPPTTHQQKAYENIGRINVTF